MKKIILSAVAVMAFGFANAQDGQFKIGVHAGLPLGDIKDTHSVNLGVDVAYLWDVADQFKAGITTGYSTYLGKSEETTLFGNTLKVDYPNYAFIPVAGTAQYSLADNLFIGLDLGYAIYAGEGDGDGGFLYQPKFGYQTEKIELYAAYKGISVDGGSVSSVNLGVNFKL